MEASVTDRAASVAWRDCGFARRDAVRARSQLPHERNQILLFLRRQFDLENQVEEFDGIFERQQSAVVQIRWTFLDAAQCKRLDRTVARLVLEEPFDSKIVHAIVEIKGRGMTRPALSLAEKDLFAPHLALRRPFTY